MRSLTRRMFAFLIPSFAAAQKASESTRSPTILRTRAYPFETLKVHEAESTKTWPILKGNTHAGVLLDLHETELAPGAAPHPPHRHAHEEMLFVREGEVELILAGGTTRLGSGSCAYLASNDLHGYRNPGNVPAKYFVFAIGNE